MAARVLKKLQIAQTPWSPKTSGAAAPSLKVEYWGNIGIIEIKLKLLYYIGIMNKKTEATIVCWGYIGTIEKKMETTMVK